MAWGDHQPLLPTGAFTGAFVNRLDCELPNGTPRIKQVRGGAFAAGPRAKIKIDAVGPVRIQNPDYNPSLMPGPGNPPTVIRDFGFGTRKGKVTLGGVELQIIRWNAKRILARIPRTGALAEPNQLIVQRGDNGLGSRVGLTLTVGLQPGQSIRRVPGDYRTI
ncbi:MAG: hypothetical protein ACUVS3_01935 [Thermodesulfobacteriota bacterium]